MSDTLHTIGRASSAATTDFVSARVDGPGGLYLNVDGNQKVSGWVPTPNAFSLLAGNGEDPLAPGHERHHCPGSTPTCRSSCYTWGIEKHAGSTYDLYRHNSVTIREILADVDLARSWATALGTWFRNNCRFVGVRWHVSGDVFSHAYAQWIADVCRTAWDVPAWIYTRSFLEFNPLIAERMCDPLVEVCTERGGNLALNLSCDADNYDDACHYRAVMKAGRLCYLTVDGTRPADLFDVCPDAILFPDYGLRAPKGSGPIEQRATNWWWQSLTSAEKRGVCPSDYYSKSEGVRCGAGACSKCLT